MVIIHRTHFTHVDGATPATAKVNLLKVLAKLEQGPIQEISLFKKEVDTLLRCYEAAGAPEMDEEQRAIWFLERLDKERHGSMLTVLKNNHAAGMAFPVTVEAAYAIAKDWMSSTARVYDAHRIVAHGAAFMLADEVRVLAVVPPTLSFSRKKGKSKA